MKNFWEKESKVVLVLLLGLCIGYIAGDKLEQRKVMVCGYEYQYQYYYDEMPGTNMPTIREGEPNPSSVDETKPDVKSSEEGQSVEPSAPDMTITSGADGVSSYYPYYPYYPSQQVLVCRYVSQWPVHQKQIVY